MPLDAFRHAGRETTAPAEAGSDEGLAAELALAAEAIQLDAGMERAGIMGDFAARMRYARRHLSAREAAAAVRALQDQKRAALAALARRTAQLVRGRLAAIRQAARRHAPKGPTQG